ncbi:MAG: PrsW family intramembrane metalloprotease [Oscillospiraceae bacterium]|nr:PrsW family intramembrane metalloprotease [Oscillospiraceae bacterium]
MTARILLALALLPAIVLMMYIRRLDKIEQEPKALIGKLLLFGALTTISAMILERLGTIALDTFVPEDTLPYLVIDNFLIVALAEEMGKFVVLKLCTWRNPNFNYTYDAVVYAVAASLGFAALENILYVFLLGGVPTAIMRAITAVPGHCIFGIFMGYFYGLAKKAEFWGYTGKKNRNLFLACAAPILVHGFYDFTLTVGTWGALLLFLVFYLTCLVVAFIRIRKMAGEDIPIGFYPEAKEEAADPYASYKSTPPPGASLPVFRPQPPQPNRQAPYQQPSYQQNPYQQSSYPPPAYTPPVQKRTVYVPPKVSDEPSPYAQPVYPHSFYTPPEQSSYPPPPAQGPAVPYEENSAEPPVGYYPEGTEMPSIDPEEMNKPPLS